MPWVRKTTPANAITLIWYQRNILLNNNNNNCIFLKFPKHLFITYFKQKINIILIKQYFNSYQ